MQIENLNERKMKKRRTARSRGHTPILIKEEENNFVFKKRNGQKQMKHQLESLTSE